MVSSLGAFGVPSAGFLLISIYPVTWPQIEIFASMRSNIIYAMVALLCIINTTYAQSWQSEKVVVGEDGCLSYPADAEGNRIPDFSYAGYHYGEVPIPDIEAVVTIGPIAGDNTQHIQDALNQVAAMPINAQGFRGAVMLEAGIYEIHGTLYVDASGLVFRGSGDGADSVANTILLGVGNTPHQRDVMRVGGNSNTRWGGKVAGTQ